MVRLLKFDSMLKDLDFGKSVVFWPFVGSLKFIDLVRLNLAESDSAAGPGIESLTFSFILDAGLFIADLACSSAVTEALLFGEDISWTDWSPVGAVIFGEECKALADLVELRGEADGELIFGEDCF